MKITLYGAASEDIAEIYKTEGKKLGREISKRGHTLVFGGGNHGMMGAVANECIENKTEVIGVVPEIFRYENLTFTKPIYTNTMRERKKVLRDEADAFIVTPGGIGTLDEFFEVLELRKQDIHLKPIAIFNINNYFSDIVNFIEKNADEGFIPKSLLKKFKVTTTAEETVDYLESKK